MPIHVDFVPDCGMLCCLLLALILTRQALSLFADRVNIAEMRCRYPRTPFSPTGCHGQPSSTHPNHSSWRRGSDLTYSACVLEGRLMRTSSNVRSPAPSDLLRQCSSCRRRTLTITSCTKSRSFNNKLQKPKPKVLVLPVQNSHDVKVFGRSSRNVTLG